MASTELWAGLGSALVFLLGLVAAAMNRKRIKLWLKKIAAYFSSYIQITIPEYGADPSQSRDRDFFVAVEAYLSEYCIHGARKLKAELGRDSKKPQAAIDDDQEIVDTFHDVGTKLWWYAYTEYPKSQIIIHNPADEKRRFYRLVFHKKIPRPHPRLLSAPSH
ncbi:hypothetical protein PVAP13_2KG126828 [Panicum virgatum]|uniref:AAA-type ATPase N-terminal domain-containing protein n=1 Tax=Panicum virgatum TaxID=38727 RepID=A0A8T0VXN6_PANVG|nr:hypothetical protein PVAP13_2KG126828 [Panicum virgatum]